MSVFLIDAGWIPVGAGEDNKTYFRDPISRRRFPENFATDMQQIRDCNEVSKLTQEQVDEEIYTRFLEAGIRAGNGLEKTERDALLALRILRNGRETGLFKKE